MVKKSIFDGLSEEECKLIISSTDPEKIFRLQYLPESYLEKVITHLAPKYIYDICTYQNLSENFISKYFNKLNIHLICQYQTLSEDFIIKYCDKLFWTEISQYQKLSESLIEKYKDRVNWFLILKYQDLSEEFRNKYIGLIK